MIQAILFDFDGVILESVTIKTEAFIELFKHYPKHIEAIKKFHINNTGISRFDKIKYFFNEIIQEPLNENKYHEYLNRFSDLVLKKVLEVEYVSGAEEFIKNYYKKYDLYIISATPTDEIRLIVEKRGLTKYFKNVFGSPTKKGEWTREILENNRYIPYQVLFIGDALSDYKAAVENNVHFIGRISDGNINPFEGLKIKHILPDMSELPKIIQSL